MAVKGTKVSQDDIARKTGLSRVTVSKALNNVSTVSPMIKKKVFDAAEELGYKFLRRNIMPSNYDQTKTIIIISTVDALNVFWSGVLHGIQQHIKDNGYISVVRIVNSRENLLVDNDIFGGLNTDDIAGFIITGRHGLSLTERLSKYQVPIVSVDSYTHLISSNKYADVILFDNFNAVFDITQNLINAGHTKIGYIGDAFTCKSLHDRWLGYECAMSENGFEVDRHLCYCGDKNYLSYTGPHEIEVFLSELEERPSAFVCQNDDVASGVIRYYTRQGIRVPNDLVVTGFDGIDEYSFDITTVKCDRKYLGQRAVEQLLRRIKNPHLMYETITLPVEIVINNINISK